jgi:hypothetical protein
MDEVTAALLLAALDLLEPDDRLPMGSDQDCPWCGASVLKYPHGAACPVPRFEAAAAAYLETR